MNPHLNDVQGAALKLRTNLEPSSAGDHQICVARLLGWAGFNCKPKGFFHHFGAHLFEPNPYSKNRAPEQDSIRNVPPDAAPYAESVKIHVALVLNTSCCKT